MTTGTHSGINQGTRVIWIGVVLLIILRQDIWFWHDSSLVFDILPIGLAWQLGISLAAAALWYLATRIAWPQDHEYAKIIAEAKLATPSDKGDEPTPQADGREYDSK